MRVVARGEKSGDRERRDFFILRGDFFFCVCNVQRREFAAERVVAAGERN